MLKKASISLIALMINGCATIVGDSSQSIPITSSPSSAKISIRDESGLEIYTGQTPTTITLQKSNGSYFGGKHYTIELKKDGYKSQTFTLDANINGWYLGGNLVFGGLIGWFIIDPFTGKMYKMSSESIKGDLSLDTSSHNIENKLKIAFLQDIPEIQRSHLEQINNQ